MVASVRRGLSGLTPTTYKLTTAEPIPNGEPVKLGEDGLVYREMPISTTSISTFPNAVQTSSTDAFMQNIVSLDGQGAVAGVQLIQATIPGHYISFLGHDGQGSLSRLHSAFLLTPVIGIRSVQNNCVLCHIPGTTKVLIHYSYSPGVNLYMYAAVVDYNGGTITATNTGTQIDPMNADHRPRAAVWLSDDVTYNYFVVTNTLGSYVISVNKTTDAIAVLANLAVGSQPVDFVTKRIDTNTFIVFDGSDYYIVQWNGATTLAQISTGAVTTRSSYAYDLLVRSATDVLFSYGVSFSYLVDENQIDEDDFLVVRTGDFAVDYLSVTLGDEQRVKTNSNDLINQKTFAERHQIYPGRNADDAVVWFEDGGILSIEVDYGTGDVSVLGRCARMYGDDYNFAPQRTQSVQYNNGNNIAVVFNETINGEINKYGYVGYNTGIAYKGTATFVGYNRTGLTVTEGAEADFSAAVRTNLVFGGYIGLTVGQVYSERADRFIYDGSATPQAKRINRQRAASTSVMIEDMPEFAVRV